MGLLWRGGIEMEGTLMGLLRELSGSSCGRVEAWKASSRSGLIMFLHMYNYKAYSFLNSGVHMNFGCSIIVYSLLKDICCGQNAGAIRNPGKETERWKCLSKFKMLTGLLSQTLTSHTSQRRGRSLNNAEAVESFLLTLYSLLGDISSVPAGLKPCSGLLSFGVSEFFDQMQAIFFTFGTICLVKIWKFMSIEDHVDVAFQKKS